MAGVLHAGTVGGHGGQELTVQYVAVKVCTPSKLKTIIET